MENLMNPPGSVTGNGEKNPNRVLKIPPRDAGRDFCGIEEGKARLGGVSGTFPTPKCVT